jgi:hypothetical protein
MWGCRDDRLQAYRAKPVPFPQLGIYDSFINLQLLLKLLRFSLIRRPEVLPGKYPGELGEAKFEIIFQMNEKLFSSETSRGLSRAPLTP